MLYYNYLTKGSLYEPLSDVDFVSATFGGNKPSTITSPKKEEKTKVDVSGVIVGSTVKHKVFGDGKVLEITGSLIAAKFEKGEKRFQFPDAFDNGFLKV